VVSPAPLESMRQREVLKHVLSKVEGTADWVLDLGPVGADKGGEIVAEGIPEQVADVPASYTGGYLKPLLNGPELRPLRRRGKSALPLRRCASERQPNKRRLRGRSGLRGLGATPTMTVDPRVDGEKLRSHRLKRRARSKCIAG
jgi:hypothetical protein